ncbi:peroxide stress protein YaaA [Sphingomonas sp. PL-96]|uniref:peroxide stress protein YaaA n=1 Tax=Sphingomonas sp. PL-96 TaxID=2887201 RepID=UPI001E3AA2B0|nr:peroxide stress protein YaaA [Sphingomonas sp. PL-96]MCC2976721.1 peroxide stress protein YaaA [Sphingomonas sp. PL-96]
MIAVISPAKSLDYETPLPPSSSPSVPRLSSRADTLAKGAAKLGAEKLASLMHISPKLAELNAARFRDFAGAPQRPAIHAFAGDVYTGFEVATLDAPAIDFAQDHLRILSGLYGLLRPLDAIRPYRLEMGTRWAPGTARTLYDWWKDQIAVLLAEDVASEESGVILNLASQEYWKAVAGKLPETIRVIEVDFREPGPDGPRFVSFHAKRARGIMARWMCEHRVTEVDAMRGFDSDGYRFDADQSSDTRWRFTRA